MRFFRLDASIRTDGSVSRSLADEVEAAWRNALPDAVVTRRDLGIDPLPPVWPDALAGKMAPPDARTDAHLRARAAAAHLVDELLEADAYLFAVPMYNFGVPQQVKHWVDLIITDDRADNTSVPLVPGRPAVLVTARGGGYAPGTPREGWDHATPWLQRILADVWGLDLTVVSAELTAADYNPAMAHLQDLARRQRADAHAAAAAAGSALAARWRPAA